MPNTNSKEYEPNVTMGPIINLGIKKSDILSKEEKKGIYQLSLPLLGKEKKQAESHTR